MTWEALDTSNRSGPHEYLFLTSSLSHSTAFESCCFFLCFFCCLVFSDCNYSYNQFCVQSTAFENLFSFLYFGYSCGQHDFSRDSRVVDLHLHLFGISFCHFFQTEHRARIFWHFRQLWKPPAVCKRTASKTCWVSYLQMFVTGYCL